MNDLFTTLDLKDFEVSYAGPGGAAGFCLGSEAGGVRFYSDRWQYVNGMPNAIRSGEAVNGVAFLGHFFAASSRDEVWIWTLPRGGGKTVYGAHFPVGAHGVIAATNGFFVAPLGLQGMMLCRPKEGEAQAVTISGGNPPVYVYRVASQQTPDGQHLLITALRRQGVGLTDFADGEGNKTLHTKTFAGLDVVDVCTVGNQRSTASAVAMGRDGTLILFDDIRIADKPSTIKFKSVDGTAYRVLSAAGYLILLTSKALHIISGLLDGLGSGRLMQPETPIMTIPMEAVDVEVANDRWVLVTLPHGVVWMDLEQLKSGPKMDREQWVTKSTTTLSPTWQGAVVQGIRSGELVATRSQDFSALTQTGGMSASA
jgi:hypothetical protein